MEISQTLEALPNGCPQNINEITLLKDLINQKPLVRLKPINRLKPELLQMPHGDGPDFLEVAQLGLGKLLVPHPPVADLNSIIPVGALSLYLGHNVPFPEAHNRHWNHLSVSLEVAHHAKLCAHHANSCLCGHDHDESSSSLCCRQFG